MDDVQGKIEEIKAELKEGLFHHWVWEKIQWLIAELEKTQTEKLPMGACCAKCGFRYLEYKGHIIPCPLCERHQLRSQLPELRAEVREWLCDKCKTVFPGPPQEGFSCVVCPKCNGDTYPMSSGALNRKLLAENFDLQATLDVMEEHVKTLHALVAELRK